jgi:hypothetical protein
MMPRNSPELHQQPGDMDQVLFVYLGDSKFQEELPTSIYQPRLTMFSIYIKLIRPDLTLIYSHKNGIRESTFKSIWLARATADSG